MYNMELYGCIIKGGKCMNKKKLLSMLFIIGAIMFSSKPTLAATETSSTSEDVIILEGMQDYENTETGEYLKWTETYSATKGVIKNFTFKIRFEVRSEDIITNSSSVTVNATANIQNSVGENVSGYFGHKYRVGLERLFWAKNTTLSVKDITQGTISGINSGSKHDLVISNENYLPSGYYLITYQLSIHRLLNTLLFLNKVYVHDILSLYD